MSGDVVARHEDELARAIGTRHAVSFAFARQALAALLEAAGLRAGDAVVLSPLTCKVVPLALLSLELRPAWADASRDTLNVDPDALAEAASASDVRAVLFQHTYGQGAGLDAAERVARERELFLLEDCAQCLPLAEAAPSAAADAPPRRGAIFSNNVMKPMPAGSGGVAVTQDDELAAGVRRVRDGLRAPRALESVSLGVERGLHAALLRPSSYWTLYSVAQRFGTHYEDLPAAEEVRREIAEKPGRIGAAQARAGSRALARCPSLLAHRRATSEAYAAELRGVAGVTIPSGVATGPLCYFPVLVPAKDELLRRAQRERIEMVPWPVRTPIYPVERESELATYGYDVGSCPVAEELATSLVGLPTHARVDDRVRERVVRTIASHCAGR